MNIRPDSRPVVFELHDLQCLKFAAVSVFVAEKLDNPETVQQTVFQFKGFILLSISVSQLGFISIASKDIR